MDHLTCSAFKWNRLMKLLVSHDGTKRPRLTHDNYIDTFRFCFCAIPGSGWIAWLYPVMGIWKRKLLQNTSASTTWANYAQKVSSELSYLKHPPIHTNVVNCRKTLTMYCVWGSTDVSKLKIVGLHFWPWTNSFTTNRSTVKDSS